MKKQHFIQINHQLQCCWCNRYYDDLADVPDICEAMKSVGRNDKCFLVNELSPAFGYVKTDKGNL